DMMEGVASEAASLAGHMRLRKMIVLYDSNDVCLAGKTMLRYTEDVNKRFEAYGWHTQLVKDGNDVEAIDAAIREAQADDRPSLITVKTVIGYGAPHKAGTSDAHGNPLGPDEVLAAKRNLGWPEEPAFLIPDDALAHFRSALDKGAAHQREWQTRFESWASDNASAARE